MISKHSLFALNIYPASFGTQAVLAGPGSFTKVLQPTSIQNAGFPRQPQLLYEVA